MPLVKRVSQSSSNTSGKKNKSLLQGRRRGRTETVDYSNRANFLKAVAEEEEDGDLKEDSDGVDDFEGRYLGTFVDDNNKPFSAQSNPWTAAGSSAPFSTGLSDTESNLRMSKMHDLGSNFDNEGTLDPASPVKVNHGDKNSPSFFTFDGDSNIDRKRNSPQEEDPAGVDGNDNYDVVGDDSGTEDAGTTLHSNEGESEGLPPSLTSRAPSNTEAVPPRKSLSSFLENIEDTSEAISVFTLQFVNPELEVMFNDFVEPSKRAVFRAGLIATIISSIIAFVADDMGKKDEPRFKYVVAVRALLFVVLIVSYPIRYSEWGIKNYSLFCNILLVILASSYAVLQCGEISARPDGTEDFYTLALIIWATPFLLGLLFRHAVILITANVVMTIAAIAAAEHFFAGGSDIPYLAMRSLSLFLVAVTSLLGSYQRERDRRLTFMLMKASEEHVEERETIIEGIERDIKVASKRPEVRAMLFREVTGIVTAMDALARSPERKEWSYDRLKHNGPAHIVSQDGFYGEALPGIWSSSNPTDRSTEVATGTGPVIAILARSPPGSSSASDIALASSRSGPGFGEEVRWRKYMRALNAAGKMYGFELVGHPHCSVLVPGRSSSSRHHGSSSSSSGPSVTSACLAVGTILSTVGTSRGSLCVAVSTGRWSIVADAARSHVSVRAAGPAVGDAIALAVNDAVLIGDACRSKAHRRAPIAKRSIPFTAGSPASQTGSVPVASTPIARASGFGATVMTSSAGDTGDSSESSNPEMAGKNDTSVIRATSPCAEDETQDKDEDAEVKNDDGDIRVDDVDEEDSNGNNTKRSSPFLGVGFRRRPGGVSDDLRSDAATDDEDDFDGRPSFIVSADVLRELPGPMGPAPPGWGGYDVRPYFNSNSANRVMAVDDSDPDESDFGEIDDESCLNSSAPGRVYAPRSQMRKDISMMSLKSFASDKSADTSNGPLSTIPGSILNPNKPSSSSVGLSSSRTDGTGNEDGGAAGELARATAAFRASARTAIEVLAHQGRKGSGARSARSGAYSAPPTGSTVKKPTVAGVGAGPSGSDGGDDGTELGPLNSTTPSIQAIPDDGAVDDVAVDDHVSHAFQMRRWLLSFVDRPVEMDYRAQSIQMGLGTIRFILALFFSVWALSVIVDLERGGEDAYWISAIRFGTVLPILAIGIACTYAVPLRFMVLLFQITVLLGSISSVVACLLMLKLAPMGEFASYGIVLLRTMMAAFTNLRLRFASAIGFAVLTVLIVGSHLYREDLISEKSPRRFFLYVFIMSLIGLVYCYFLELTARKLFIAMGLDHHLAEMVEGLQACREFLTARIVPIHVLSDDASATSARVAVTAIHISPHGSRVSDAGEDGAASFKVPSSFSSKKKTMKGDDNDTEAEDTLGMSRHAKAISVVEEECVSFAARRCGGGGAAAAADDGDDDIDGGNADTLCRIEVVRTVGPWVIVVTRGQRCFDHACQFADSALSRIRALDPELSVCAAVDVGVLAMTSVGGLLNLVGRSIFEVMIGSERHGTAANEPSSNLSGEQRSSRAVRNVILCTNAAKVEAMKANPDLESSMTFSFVPGSSLSKVNVVKR